MIGVLHTDGSVDYHLVGLWSGAREQKMWRWAQEHPDFAPGLFTREMHRLFLEGWLGSHREALQGDVMDVGQPFHRHWGGDGYFTFGLGGDCDLTGDITNMPEIPDNSLDAIVCAEVLEHCERPPEACRELYRVLRPGGLLLVAAPFIWPDHHTDAYPDFWRFTIQAWELLLSKQAGFTIENILRIDWSDEGFAAYETMRRYEGMGFRGWTDAATGYCVEARKPLCG